MLRRSVAPVLALAVALTTGSAGAAPDRLGQKERQAEISAEIRSLREQVSEASAEEAALLDRLDEVQGRRRDLDGKVAALDRQVAAITREAAEAEALLEAVQGDFVGAQTRLAAADEQLAGEHRELRERAVAAYIGNPVANGAELLLRARSLRELAAGAGYLESLVEAQKRSVDRYVGLRRQIEELRAAVESRKDAARAQRDLVLSRRAELETVRGEHEAVRRQVLAEEDAQARLVDEVRSRKAEFEGEIAVLRAESSSITAFLRGVQVGQAPVTGRRGLLASPIPGAPMSSPYGPRVHPIFGDLRQHDGMDFRAGSGVPIQAAAAGTVVFAGPRGGYGNATIIDHGGSVATLYAHQSLVSVLPGTQVARGQVIGAVGSTGFSTGPHLHFEVRVGGVPVDPLLFL